MNGNDTLTACSNALEYYKTIWNDDKWGLNDNYHFWQKSNQVHSYLRFAVIANDTFPKIPGLNPPAPPKTYWFQLVMDSEGKPVTEFLDDFWFAASNALQSQGFWADDYGWGGMACLFVAQLIHDGVIPPQDDTTTWRTWRDRAIECFKEMECALAKAQGGVPVPGGCSNKPVVVNPDHENDPYLKNTVTNAVCFCLAMQLYDFIQNVPDTFCPITAYDCLHTAYQQYKWFDQWIATPEDDNKGILSNFYHPFLFANFPGAMLEDRPVAPAPKGTYPTDGPSGLPWNKGAAWTGDQGLFLHACGLMLRYVGDLSPVLGINGSVATNVKNAILGWIPSIKNGITVCLAGALSNLDFVLREPPYELFYKFGTGDPADYVSGRGVLVRFLNLQATLDAFQTANIDFKATFHDIFGFSAQAASQTKETNAPTGQLSASWNPQFDTNANAIFWKAWDPNNQTPSTYSWDTLDIVIKTQSEYVPLWKNYCMMIGFDIYSAWLNTNTWSLGSTEEGKSLHHGKNKVIQENGVNGSENHEGAIGG